MLHRLAAPEPLLLAERVDRVQLRQPRLRGHGGRWRRRSRVELQDVDAALVVDDVDVVGPGDPVRRRGRAPHWLEEAHLLDRTGALVDGEEAGAVLVPRVRREIAAAVTAEPVLAHREPV